MQERIVRACHHADFTLSPGGAVVPRGRDPKLGSRMEVKGELELELEFENVRCREDKDEVRIIEDKDKP